MSVLAGTGRLLQLAIRRDRIKLPVWIVSIVGLMVAMVMALKESYPSAVEQAAYLQLLDTSAIGRLFAGTSGGISLASVVMAETALYVGLAVAFMSALLVIRHTRYNEDLGSSELMQSARVGRYAALTSALGLAFFANMVVAAGLGLVLQASNVGTSEQAWAYGIGQGLLGVSFAALAGVAAQAAGSSRGASSLASLGIGVAFLLRGVGDIFATVKDGGYEPLWLSWLSPFGWLQQAYPLGDVRWWVFGIFVLCVVAATAFSYILLSRRDVGAGLFAAAGGSPRASRRLLVLSPLGLALELQKGVFIGWLVTAVIFAIIIGGIADQIGELIEKSEIMQQYIAGLGGTTAAIESMLSAMIGIIMLVVVAYVIQAMGKARTEEVSGRLESLLATHLGRTRWLLSHISIVIVGTLVITTLAGAIVAIAAGVVQELPVSEWSVGAYALAGLSYAPALLVFAGIVTFGIGLYPKIALGVAWLAFAFVAVVSQLGALLKLPDWVVDLSPLSHIAIAPSEDIAWKLLIVLSAVVVGFVLVGLVAFRQRDVVAN